jgi:hypothetical protein
MSEKVELLSGGTDNIIGLDFQDIEFDSFRQGSALAGNNNITFLNGEGRGSMAGNVFMSFLETLIFLHVVEIVSTDNNSVGHFGRDDHTSKNK